MSLPITSVARWAEEDRAPVLAPSCPHLSLWDPLTREHGPGGHVKGSEGCPPEAAACGECEGLGARWGIGYSWCWGGNWGCGWESLVNHGAQCWELAPPGREK